jgi:membrane protease YdiL (CAAX protease family)
MDKKAILGGRSVDRFVGEISESVTYSILAISTLVLSPFVVASFLSFIGVEYSVLFQSAGIFQNPLQQALYLTVSLVLIGIYLKFSNRLSVIHTSKPQPKILLWIVFGLGLLLLSNSSISQMFAFFDVSIGANSGIENPSGNPIYYLYLIPIMIFFVGPVEEIVFRGITQGSFRENFSLHTSVIFTSIIFGLIHIPSIQSEGYLPVISYVLITCVLGLILGYIYEKTEDIVVPCLVHGIYNSFLLVFTFYSKQSDVVSLIL